MWTGPPAPVSWGPGGLPRASAAAGGRASQELLCLFTGLCKRDLGALEVTERAGLFCTWPVLQGALAGEMKTEVPLGVASSGPEDLGRRQRRRPPRPKLSKTQHPSPSPALEI